MRYLLFFVFLFSITTSQAQWENFPQHNRSLAAAVDGNAIWHVTINGLLKRDLNGNLLEEHNFDRFIPGAGRFYFGGTTDMTIDPSGNIWLAIGQTNSSYQALVKFDGSDWTIYPRADIPNTTGSYVYNIEATPNGRVYADNYTELLEFDGTEWSVVPNNPASGTVRDLATSANGEIAMAFDQEVVTYTPSAGWQIVHAPTFPAGYAYLGAVAYNAQNELHVIYYSGEVYKLVNGTSTLVSTSAFDLGYLTDADFSPTNELFVTGSSGSGLVRWDGNNWESWASVSGVGFEDPTFVDFDATGGVWFGRTGLKRHKNSQIDIYRSGIIGEDYGDAAGDWVFTSNGKVITRYNTVTQTTEYFDEDDFGFLNVNGTLRSLAGEPNGNFYIGLWQGGVKYYNGSTFQVIAGAPSDVLRMDVAPNGTLYASEGYAFSFPSDGFHTYQNGTWTNYGTANSSNPSDNIRDIFVDNQGRAWLASEVGLILFENGTFTNFNTTNSNIATDEIRQVAGSSDGSTIWLVDRSIATLQRYQNGTFTNSASQNVGYQLNVLSADNQGNAWFSLTHDGNGLGPMGALKINTTSIAYQGEFASKMLDTWDGTVFNDEKGGVWFAGSWGAAHYLGDSDLAVTLSMTPVTCNGGEDGTTTASITGGTPPYEFFWYRYGYPSYFYGDEQYYYDLTATDLPRLGMDFYVRDANGLTAGSAISVTQPSLLQAQTVVNGNSITVTPSGGVMPYEFVWSNGATGITASNLADGNYLVTITDANGCTQVRTGFVGDLPTGYCTGSNFVPWNSYIGAVRLADINAGSGKDNGNPLYLNYSTSLTKGSTENMEVIGVMPYSSAVMYIRAWIDWNQNGTFETSEMVFDQSQAGSNTNAGSYPLSQNINVPNTALSGNTMMRVMMRLGTAPDPCDSGITGEVENYPIHVVGGGGSTCAISASLDQVECFDNNTPDNPNDDAFFVYATISQSGSCGSGWTGGGTLGTYDVQNTFGPYPISMGSVTLTFSDLSTNTATTSLTANAPAPCSNGSGGTCTNNLLDNPSYTNGASSWSGNVDLTSDANSAPNAVRSCQPYLPVRQTISAQPNTMYSLQLNAKRDAAAAGVVSIKFLSSGWSPIASEFIPITSTLYSLYTKNITSPADAAYVEISFFKDGGTGCVYADDWCLTTGGGGNPCAITAAVQNIQCNNNGTDQNPNDDRFTFDLLVTGSNTGSGWTGFVNGVPKSGSYGVAQQIGVYDIATGDVTFTISDADDAGCTASATAVAPAPCSTPSGGTCSNNVLQNSGFNNGAAIWNINGTGADFLTGSDPNAYVGTTAEICQTGTRLYQTVNVDAGKMYTLQAQAKRSQTARALLVIKYLDANWTPLLQDFHTAESAVYALESLTLEAPVGAVRAEISFYHNGGTGCVYADDFCFSENGSSNNCSISAVVSNVQCTNNGTPITPLDDMYTFDVTVTNTGNCGTTWSGGGTTGSYGVATSFGPFPILNGNQIFTFTDVSNPTATSTVTAMTPAPCSNGSNGPDLTVENLNLGSSVVDQGDVVLFNFDLKNIGNALADGDFTIKSYLSTDAVLSSDDVQDGAIPTGFLAAGQEILQTGGAFTVPYNLPNGQYYILLEVDADDQITETNEGNNVTVAAGTLSVGSSPMAPDVELSISASPQSPGQWKNTTITLTVTNAGTTSVSGIGITTPNQSNTAFRDLLAYVSHTESTGTNFNSWFGTWDVGFLAAGESRTLTYEGFTKVAGPIPFFAQVTAQNETDMDSAPNSNNGNTTPNEDDEAIVVINGPMPFIGGVAGKVVLDTPIAAAYPNPASSFLMLDLSDYKGTAVDASMTDMYGRVILSEKNLTEATAQLDLQTLNTGSYILQLKAENMRPVVLKIIVEKGH